MIPVGAIASMDRVSPVVSLDTPAQSATVNGTLALGATVSDNDAIASVQFKVDGSNIGAPQSVGPFAVNHDTHLLANGAHTYSVVATDRVGNVTTVTHNVTVGNTAPAAGDVAFGSYFEFFEEDGQYEGGRWPLRGFDQRLDDDWVWSGTGSKMGTLPLPANPDPTHYQMRVQLKVDEYEGGTDANKAHIWMYVDAAQYDGFNQANGDSGGLNGPVVNVNGGEAMWFVRWCTVDGYNTSKTNGLSAHYSFVVKAGYLS